MSHIEELKSVLDSLKRIESVSLCEKFGFDFNSLQDYIRKSIVYNVVDIHDKARKISRCLANNPILIELQKESASELVSDYRETLLNRKSFPSARELLSVLRNIGGILSALILVMKEYKDFVYEKFESEAVDLALQNYVKVGQEIRNDAAFPGSPIDDLEQIALNTDEYFKDKNRIERFQVSDNSAFQGCFVALCAPSFEGKTQSAFVFKNVRPLYFVTDPKVLDEKNVSIQPIYYNYKSVSVALLHYAKLDCHAIKHDGRSIDNLTYNTRKNERKFLKVSANYLDSRHRETKLWTLGFLKELVLDAKENYDSKPESERPTWMEYHADRRNFLFNPSSIAELVKDKDLFKGYCLFLDEFTGDLEKIMIRNLARLIDLRCIVANTNATIANHSVQIHSRMRMTGIAAVWSIVFTRLNPVSYNVMKNIYNIDALAENLMNRFSVNDPEYSHFKYFTELLSGQHGEIKIVRSGLMGTVIEAIKSVMEQTPIEIKIGMRKMLDEIVQKVSDKLRQTKFSKKRPSIDGIMANLNLLTQYSYESELRSNLRQFFHNNLKKTFLSDHLYYLINPVDETNSLFLTYSPGMDLRIKVKRGNDFYDEDWDYEYTCFPYEDILTLLACMSIPSKNTISKESFVKSNTQLPNSITRRVYELENFAAYPIIKSSHFQISENSSRLTLAGQDGVSFLKNILLNCKLQSNSNFILDFKHKQADDYNFDLDHFLKNITVPFLCPCNKELPDFLAKFNLTDPLEDAVHVGTFKSIPGGDACFEMYFRNPVSQAFAKRACPITSTNTVSSSFKAVVECKNWENSIASDEVRNILERALETDHCIMNFIFCNSISNPQEIHQSLINLCNEKKILLYRINKADNNLNGFTTFVTAPYYVSRELDFESSEAELICFVIELAQIH